MSRAVPRPPRPPRLALHPSLVLLLRLAEQLEPPCRTDPGVWGAGPDHELDVAAAVAGCRRCNLLELCARAALDISATGGIWGATDFSQPGAKARLVRRNRAKERAS